MKKLFLLISLIALLSCANEPPATVEAFINEPEQETPDAKQTMSMVVEESPTAVAMIDGVSYNLTVFENGTKTYTTTAELENGDHTITSFNYDGVEYLTLPMSFTVNNARVKQITINAGQPGSRSLTYEDLDFGYAFMEFQPEEEPVTFDILFHSILGVKSIDLPNYIGSTYESQPDGLQSFMKGLYRVQYYHDSIPVAVYGLFTYNSGAPIVTYIDNPDVIDHNMFKIQHLRWLPGVGMAEVVGNDFTIIVLDDNLITGDNGIVNIDIVPNPTWNGSADYTLYYE